MSLAWWLTFVAPVRRSDLHVFVAAAARVLHGHTPYLPLASTGVYGGSAFVYPYVVSWAFAPFALVPFAVADVAFFIVSVAAVCAALVLLGVRHPVAFLAVLAAAPTIRSLQVGAINSLLLLAMALAWRLRERWPAAGLSVAAAVVAKLFLAPLILWLVLTRRWRAAVVVAVVSVGIIAAGCEISGQGVRGYRHMLGALGAHESVQGYSVVGQLTRAGLPYAVAQVCGLILAAAAIACGYWVRRVTVTAEDGDAQLFICCLVGALVASPIVWSHYLLLLAVVPALLRLRPRWFVLLAVLSWIPGFPAGGPVWVTSTGAAITSWVQHGTVYALLAAAVLLPVVRVHLRRRKSPRPPQVPVGRDVLDVEPTAAT